MGGMTKNGVRIWSVDKKPLPLHPHKAQMAESVDPGSGYKIKG